MPTRDDLLLLAAYNGSMNAKLYGAAATLSDEALMADRQAFFGSLFGTLTHLVNADIIWLKRFTAHRAQYAALAAMDDIAKPPSLAHPLCATLPELAAWRLRLDAVIAAWAAEVRDGDLDAPLDYVNARGAQRKHFGSVVLHFFNHQTHHRGQASTLLSQAGVDIGVTDLLERIPTCGDS